MRGWAMVIVVTALVFMGIGTPAVQADSGDIPQNAAAGLTDGSAIAWATSSESNAEKLAGGHSRAATLTAYKPVCEQDLPNSSQSFATSYTTVDTCHRASSFCPAQDPDYPQTAMWVMKAPASPPPTAGDWVNTGIITCVASGKATPKIVVTQADFRKLPIPAPKIIVQPADGYTLINIGTNFLTVKQSVVLPTTVLGQPVRVRATPSSYVWRYGDGGSLATSDPGDYYPDMPTAHTFTGPGTYRVSLATTFTGEFSVSGGPWQPIDGTATTQSRGTTVHAEERRAVLVG